MATDSAPAQWLWPGRVVLRWSDQHGLWRLNHPLISWLTVAALAISLLIAKLDPRPQWLWIAGSLLAFEIFIKYLDCAAAAVDRELRAEIWRQVMRLNERVSGNLAVILERIAERINGSVSPAQYKERINALKVHLLSHVVDVLNIHLGLEPAADTISANWALRGKDAHTDEFRVSCYDRHMASRRTREDRWHKIDASLPGASRAFLDREPTFVPDTHSPDLAEHFGEKPSYRSIISIPVECLGDVIGVLNVDSTEVGVLDAEHAALIADVAYLIGLCDMLERMRPS